MDTLIVGQVIPCAVRAPMRRIIILGANSIAQSGWAFSAKVLPAVILALSRVWGVVE
jgi:hypothetical protein